MPVMIPVAVAQPAPVVRAGKACRSSQLRLTVDGRDADFNGMSHTGTALSIRNIGPECVLPRLPKIRFRDASGRLLPAAGRVAVGMHAGPVMIPIRLTSGHRATTGLRWVSGPVYPRSTAVHASGVTVRLGAATLRARLTAVLYGETGAPVTFDQSPLRLIRD